MSTEIILVTVVIVILLALSAFFSGSETALTAASRARLHAMEIEGSEEARRVNKLLEHPERMIGTILLGNNLVNISASALSTSLLIGMFGEVGVAYATVVMTVLVVIFSEVLPKTYAIAYADRIALAVAPLMQLVIAVLRPAVFLIEQVVNLVLKLTPSHLDDNANILAAHDEIRGTIELQSKEGAVGRHDAEMLGGILDLRDLKVEDIMVHRTKMETLNADDPPDRVVAEILKAQYSRIPIWREEPENIVAVLHTKDLLTALGEADWDVSRLDLMSFAKKPWFVPDTTGVKDQLNQFLKQKQQMALVVDEYGEVQGLITLEDILEEIVGEIRDEHDTELEPFLLVNERLCQVQGQYPIEDFNKQFEVELDDETADTVGGFVVDHIGRVPKQGEKISVDGLQFEITAVKGPRIERMRVRKMH